MENTPSDPGPAGAFPEGFRLVRELAPSGSSSVYLAEDLANGGQVTLTSLGSFGDPSVLHRLTRETDAVTDLRHPHILAARAVTDRDGRAYLVNPYVEDPDLGQRLASWGPLPPPTALQILGQMADALDAAHRVGVVHGGVRPGAVRFAAGTGQPYLVGFGAGVGRAPDTATTDVSAYEHLAPEQVVSAPVTPRTDVHALGGLLFHCLTGVPPFRGPGPGNVLMEIQHAEPPRVSSLRLELPAELDRVVATAMAKDPAHRYDTCRALVDAASAAVGLRTVPMPQVAARPPRWRIGWVIAAVLVVAALVAGGVVAAPYVVAAFQPTEADLARVPAAVRGSCGLAGADARLPAARRVLRCTDGGGQAVLVGLHADAAAADGDYRALVASSPAANSGPGDCGRTTGWDHPYPGVGEPRGRVLCDRVGPAARLAWLDRANRSVTIAERPDGNALELYRTWSGWVQLPAFPTPQEQELLDVLAQTDCQRAPAGLMDGLDGAVAGVECVPIGSGASTVVYHRFADATSMQRAYDSDVASAAVPSGVFCAGAGATGDGEGIYALRIVNAGRLLCSTDESGEHVLTYTVTAMSVLGRATGSDRTALATWWLANGLPRQEAIYEAVNRQSRPPFPTALENELLEQIPTASRVNCVRPPPEYIRSHVGGAAAAGGNVIVVAMACGTNTGPRDAFYYRFEDAAALNAFVGTPTGPDCATVPPGSAGSARYTRPDGSTGILRCGTNDAREAYVAWSDDQTLIYGVATGPDAARLLAWWQTDAGPL